MRGLTRRWVYRTAAEPPPAPGVDAAVPLIQRVLWARGLSEAAAIRRFCEPKLTDLCDPQLMPNIDTAATRLVEAVRGNQSIVIYGDYDVDGITALAILYHVLKAVAPQVKLRTYIPHRLDEGYGLNSEALRQLRADGADLAITVDCGITALEQAKTARDVGLDLIITDHHHLPESGGPLPDAVAVVHPRLPGSEYPFGELSGAGVAFKLAWRFATMWCGSQRVGRSLQEVLLNMLPLAALGTIADVVPLVDENRTIAAFGLRWIKQTPIVGLRALIETSDLMHDEIDCEKVGFVLGPRLNACGRMGHAAEAAHLLTAAAPAEATEIAQRLTKLNRQRQQTQRTIAQHADQLAQDVGMTADDQRMIILCDDTWHAGVVGIVCSRLVERYGRPTILLQQDGDSCKGSARSIDGYSIHDALAANAHHLTSFGGHDLAAGLTLRSADLAAFTAAMTEHANANISVEQLTPAASIDCDVTLRELDFDSVKRIATLSPFGRGNPRPALCVRAVTLGEPPCQIGANGRHLTMKLRQDEPNGRQWLRTVWWNAGSRAADLAAGMRIDAIIEPKLNTFNGRTNVEGELRDVRICQT